MLVAREHFIKIVGRSGALKTAQGVSGWSLRRCSERGSFELIILGSEDFTFPGLRAGFIFTPELINICFLVIFALLVGSTILVLRSHFPVSARVLAESGEIRLPLAGVGRGHAAGRFRAKMRIYSSSFAIPQRASAEALLEYFCGFGSSSWSGIPMTAGNSTG